jgi:heme exporter protein D
MTLGPHADFIIAAYAAALVIIIGLVGWVLLDYQMLRRVLGALEKRGVKRRSPHKKPTTVAKTD